MNDSEQPGTNPTGAGLTSQPAAPQQPIAPPPTQPVTPTVQPVVPPTPVAAPTSAPSGAGGSKKKLFIIMAAVGGALLLGIILAVCWLTLWSPQAQAKRLSNSFMKAMTTGDVTKAVELSGDPSAKEFLQKGSDSVKGSYKISDSAYQDSKGYYLYTLSGADKKYARTIIAKDDGKLVVNSFVYSNSELRLIPGKSDTTSSTSSSEETAPTKATTTTPAATTTLACLTQDDYKWMNYDKEPSSVTYDDTYDPSADTFNKTDSIFFKPDTTNEDSFTSVYDDWADFAQHNSGKQWKFRLEGSTYGSDSGTAASKALADARAQKVKAQLVQRGVPADRIIIDPPHNYGAEVQDERLDQIYRSVKNTIDPTCTGATSSSSTTTGR